MAAKAQKAISTSAKRKELEDDIQRFLSAGGAIEEVQTGLSGDKNFQPNGVGDTRPCTTVRIHSQISYGAAI